MRRLLFGLLVVLYGPIAAAGNDKEQVNTESQFDVSPQSISIDTMGQIGENVDMFVPTPLNADAYRYTLPNWRPPVYPVVSPYYGNLQYMNRMNPMMNRYYAPYAYPLPVANRLPFYPRIPQYPVRTAYTSMPSDSDLQFSYLMTHPHAAMTYQNLI